MGLNLDAVGAVSEPAERSWDHKDALLYALGVGAGALGPDRIRARLHHGELGRGDPAGPAHLHHHRGAGRSAPVASLGDFDRPCWSTASGVSPRSWRSAPPLPDDGGERRRPRWVLPSEFSVVELELEAVGPVRRHPLHA